MNDAPFWRLKEHADIDVRFSSILLHLLFLKIRVYSQWFHKQKAIFKRQKFKSKLYLDCASQYSWQCMRFLPTKLRQNNLYTSIKVLHFMHLLTWKWHTSRHYTSQCITMQVWLSTGKRHLSKTKQASTKIPTPPTLPKYI